LDAFLQRRLEASAAQNQMKESGVHVSKQYSNKQNKFAGEHRVMGQEVEADSDVSIIGFILQQRLPELLDFLSNESATLRYAALLLLGTLLRQGMLCPLDLIGKLIGLQGDPDYLIRGEALRIIQTEDERRSMFLDNRMLEGIEAALAHQLSVIQAPKALDDFSEKVDCGEDADISFSSNRERTSADMASVFKPLYMSCIQSNTKRKLEFLNGCVRKLLHTVDRFRELENVFAAQPQQPSQQTSKQKKASKVLMSEVKDSLELLRYIMLTLAYLPYELNEEPLTIIYHINKYVPMNTGLLLDRMRTTLLATNAANERGQASEMLPPALGQRSKTAPAAASNGKRGKQQPGADDAVSKHAWDEALLFEPQKFLSSFTNGNGSNNSSESAVQVNQLCAVALQSCQSYCLENLLKLKYFLKKCYNLTDDRCSAFNPEDRGAGSSSSAASSSAAATSAVTEAGEENGVEGDGADSGTTKSAAGAGSGGGKDKDSNALDRVKPMDMHDMPVISLDLSNKMVWGEDTFNFSHPASTANVLKHHLLEVSHLLTPVELSRTWIKNSVVNYNNLLVLLDGDPNDFTLAKKKVRAGKQKTGASAGAGTKRAKQASSSSSKKQAGRKKKATKYCDSSDSDNEADFEQVFDDDEDEFGRGRFNDEDLDMEFDD
jgi:hypothetical protein